MALGGWGVRDLLRIQRDISAGEKRLKAAKASDMAKPHGVSNVVAGAVSRFRAADGIAHSSVPLKLVRPIPLFGHQVAVVRSMTHTALEVGAIGSRAATAVQARLDGASQGPAGRVALLETAVQELNTARVRIGGIQVPHDRWVLPPLRSARARLAGSLVSAQGKVTDALVMADALRRMFVGPSRYLILAGNNAELRAGGMPLSAGVAEIRDGAMTIPKFVPTSSLFLLHGAVPVPEGVHEMFGWMSIGEEWRATTATPNFPLSGQVYAEMARRAGLGPVDGVLFIDVVALRAVVAATGPVDVGGTQYSKKNIEQQLMNENYLLYGDPAEQQDARHDLQSQVGVAVFDALNARPVKLGPLVSNLSAAGKGRHLLGWSADPSLEAAFQRAHVDGALAPDGFVVHLENVSANKLDWYIKPRIALKTLWIRRGVRRVELSVTFTNTPRSRTSPVVEGLEYDKSHGMEPGEHRVFLVAYLPGTAANVGAADPPFSHSGTDGGLKIVGFVYGVKVGETRTVKITFQVPKNQVFTLMPSARAHPVTVTIGKHKIVDTQPTPFVL